MRIGSLGQVMTMDNASTCGSLVPDITLSMYIFIYFQRLYTVYYNV